MNSKYIKVHSWYFESIFRPLSFLVNEIKKSLLCSSSFFSVSLRLFSHAKKPEDEKNGGGNPEREKRKESNNDEGKDGRSCWGRQAGCLAELRTRRGGPLPFLLPSLFLSSPSILTHIFFSAPSPSLLATSLPPSSSPPWSLASSASSSSALSVEVAISKPNKWAAEPPLPFFSSSPFSSNQPLSSLPPLFSASTAFCYICKRGGEREETSSSSVCTLSGPFFSARRSPPPPPLIFLLRSSFFAEKRKRKDLSYPSPSSSPTSPSSLGFSPSSFLFLLLGG